uniref:DDE Tnp4 domain-containing protein n=1 Tax=Chrysemys picta bellii TaxID=8478 RepID=A0A8C3IME0_CHRPI
MVCVLRALPLRAAGMDPKLLTSMLLTLNNMLRMAVELFLKLQRQEECDIDLARCSSYDMRLLVTFTEVLTTVERCFWARETSTEWWDHIVMHIWDDEQWLQNFRVRKATFMGLCDELVPALRCKDPRIRAALPLEKSMAIALWKLDTPDCYQLLANQFAMGKLIVGLVLTDVCRAINHILLGKTVTLGKVHDIVDGFTQMGFHNCGVVIDGTHITILAPDLLATEYINLQGYFSMVFQVLVDHREHFTDINTGWSGKVHDTRIFQNTGLFRKLQAWTFFPDQKITIGEVEMPIVILCDPPHPLMPWLTKPYTGQLNSSKEQLNNRLSKCSMTVECAFGSLKAHWCCPYGKLDLAEDYIPMLISGYFMLHNICEGKGERFTQGWTTEAQRMEAEFEQPETRAIRGAQRGAISIRDALRQQFEAKSH